MYCYVIDRCSNSYKRAPVAVGDIPIPVPPSTCCLCVNPATYNDVVSWPSCVVYGLHSVVRQSYVDPPIPGMEWPDSTKTSAVAEGPRDALPHAHCAVHIGEGWHGRHSNVGRRIHDWVGLLSGLFDRQHSRHFITLSVHVLSNKVDNTLRRSTYRDEMLYSVSPEFGTCK